MNVSLNNLGTVNKNKVTLVTEQHELQIYFSYEIPVSFSIRNRTAQADDGQFTDVTRVNDWGRTTGKFLNELEPDKKKRVDGSVFTVLLMAAIARVTEGLSITT